jgi:hypothetical protein
MTSGVALKSAQAILLISVVAWESAQALLEILVRMAVVGANAWNCLEMNLQLRHEAAGKVGGKKPAIELTCFGVGKYCETCTGVGKFREESNFAQTSDVFERSALTMRGHALLSAVACPKHPTRWGAMEANA